MSDGTGGIEPPKRDEAGRIVIVVIGVGLVLVGLTLLGRQFLWPWLPFARVWTIMRDAGWGLGLILVGIITIVWAQRQGFTPPAKGARLYRSRKDRVLAGVLGGLAEYLHADPTLVRLAYVGLALVFRVWPAIFAYVVAVIIVPEASAHDMAAQAPQPPAPPSSSGLGPQAPPAPPPPPPPSNAE